MAHGEAGVFGVGVGAGVASVVEETACMDLDVPEVPPLPPEVPPVHLRRNYLRAFNPRNIQLNRWD